MPSKSKSPEMISRGATLLVVPSILVAAPVYAQAVDPERAAAVDAAEHAAAEAEAAAGEAERAAAAARRAARSARQAATQAHIAAYGQPPALVATGTEPRVDAALPPEENLPVRRPSTSVAKFDPADAQRQLSSGLGTSVANGPNESALKSSPIPEFQLLASSKDKVASLAWTFDLSRQPRSGKLALDQLTLTASGKLNDSGDAEIVGLDGFTNGSEIKLFYIHYSTDVVLDGTEKDEVAQARERCLAQLGAKPDECNPYDYAGGVSMFVAKYYPGGLRNLLRTVLPSSIWYYGAGFTGNQASYKYLDRATFAVKKEDHFGFGGTLFGGVLLNRGQTSIGGSFDYRRSHKERDPITLCQLVAGTAQTQCLTAPDGSPKRGTQAILGLEFRHAFPVDVGSYTSLAIAPKFSADVDNDAYSLAFPIYFADDGTGKLRGGIRGVYLNKQAATGGREEDFTLGLFVGVPFSVFQR